MSLFEIERQMRICRVDISACNSAINILGEGMPILGDSKLNLQNSIVDLDNGYKSKACKLCTEQVEKSKLNSEQQINYIRSIITGLQNNINYFNQRLQELEREKAAEIARLNALLKQKELKICGIS